MAEVLATMVVGPLVSMVKEKASSYLLDQYNVMDGMEEQHKLLKRKLPAVMDVIADAEEQAAKNREGAKAWLEELRTVAYKANDVLDEFKYEALRRKAKAEGHYKEFGMDVIKLFPSHNRYVFRYRMANKLRIILQEIDVLIAEMNTFRFKFKPQPAMSLKWRQTDPNTPDHFVKIASDSRGKEKEEIVGALLGQKDNVGLTVLPIVGMGGMGKTTLAQLVYNDSAIQKHFQVRLWVCVSENFDVDSLFQTIVKEAEKNGYEMTGASTMEKFKSAVSGKKYLLVLDDVWNREAYKWEKLRSYLHHGGTGSSVVTTTRDEYIAQLMGTIKTHEIKGLDSNFIQEIIMTGAFGSQAQVTTEFNKLVGDIANRCKGSPLAATALGTALRTRSTVQEWEAILSRNTICDEENGVLQILKLSYNCLPPHMRQCFAFCAMFPKDHKIDVEMLIRLWMANCFIPEQKGVCIEVTGQQIFNELAQRSFFQEVKQVGSDTEMHYRDEHRYCSRITCKIHDLMHDVAQDSMREECVAIYTKLSQSEDFPYTARHVFLSVAIPENILNPSPEKGSPVIQTLICERLTNDLQRFERSSIDDLQHLLPECRSVRALKTTLSRPKEQRRNSDEGSDAGAGEGSARQKSGVCFICHTFGEKQRRRETEPPATHLAQPQLWCGSGRRVPNRPSFIEPKYLHHLRYLDLSGSDMEALPEEITILYHLQTLNLSHCGRLERLPKAMKYMTALRHLYTHGCSSLKSMPPDLAHLTCLQTLTCFVVGTGSGCSNVGELEKLDLGSQLELRQLENATGADVKAANLWDKKRLDELKLSWSWTDRDKEVDKKVHKEVLEGLRPHDGLKALRMDCCGSSGIPTWMLELQGMVELELRDCQNLEKLPALWQLQSLQFLYLHNLKILHCLFSGGAPAKFQKLKRMDLGMMPKFETWWDTNEVQREEPLFPEVEYLKICYCKNLTALPKASVVTQSCGKDDTECRSAFPSLREMELSCLKKFHRWEAVEETLGEDVTFPQLEKLEIWGCPGLTTFPKAPKLTTLKLWGCSEEASLQAASRYINSLSSMTMHPASHSSDCNKEENSIEVVVGDHESPCTLGDLVLRGGCDHFFYHSVALVLWNCFGQLAQLEIIECDALVYWPEKVFRGLVSLRTLKIWFCSELTGLTEDEASGQQSALVQRSGNLPRLESLEIDECESLLQVPNLSASLKTLHIYRCKSLKSIIFGQLVSEEGVVQPVESTAVLKPVPSSASSNHCFFPCLESLEIQQCEGLTEVANFPPSIETLDFWQCGSLASLSGEVRSLEQLTFIVCGSLESLLNGPHQVYSSLRVLHIQLCGIKQLPPSLQQRLDHLDEKDLDRHHEEQVELDSKPESMSNGASTAVLLKQPSSTGSNSVVFPCLETLEISGCDDLTTEVINIPPCIKTLSIQDCQSLVSLSGEVPSLKKLIIRNCPRLQSLPNGPHGAYSSLRFLIIDCCTSIKQLPQSLQEHLDHLERKDLDTHLLQASTELTATSGPSHLQGPAPTGRITALMSKLACFRSRGVRRLDHGSFVDSSSDSSSDSCSDSS